MLSDSVDTFSSVEDKIDNNFQTLTSDRREISSNLTGMADDIQILIDRYKAWEADLTDLQERLDFSFFTELVALRRKEFLSSIIDKLEHLPELSKAELEEISEHVRNLRL